MGNTDNWTRMRNQFWTESSALNHGARIMLNERVQTNLSSFTSFIVRSNFSRLFATLNYQPSFTFPHFYFPFLCNQFTQVYKSKYSRFIFLVFFSLKNFPFYEPLLSDKERWRKRNVTSWGQREWVPFHAKTFLFPFLDELVMMILIHFTAFL